MSVVYFKVFDFGEDGKLELPEVVENAQQLCDYLLEETASHSVEISYFGTDFLARFFKRGNCTVEYERGEDGKFHFISLFERSVFSGCPTGTVREEGIIARNFQSEIARLKEKIKKRNRLIKILCRGSK